MGDNIWLGDRDGVRTPMQWTPDRNAGFSAATPGKLHLPAIQDPVYGYQSVNVEAQLENASSLLHWTRRMIHARRSTRRSGSARSPTSAAPTRRVLSYAREHVDRRRHADVIALRQQPVPLPAAGRARPAPVGGHACPIELLGGVPFPRIGELPYLLTLGGYGFYWFRLTAARRPRRASCRDRRPPRDRAARRLPRPSARWFGGKGRPFDVTDVRTPRRACRAAADGRRIDLVDGRLRRRATASDRALPGAAGVLRRARRTGSTTPSSAGGRTPSSAALHAYDALHDREAMALLAARLRRDDRRPTAALDVPPAAGARPRPRGALDAVHRRAVQLLGGLRRGRAAEGVPQGHARASTPTSRSTRC